MKLLVIATGAANNGILHFTELAYSYSLYTEGVISRILHEGVYFVHISPIFSCWVARIINAANRYNSN